MWKDVEPFYPTKKEADPKTVESRGTESILNALILARYAANDGELTQDARKAFDNMWAEQIKTGDSRGSWPWLQFHNSPWEGDSQYYGATLAAIATGIAPGEYRSRPEIHDGLKLLSDYLVREQASQILYHRVMLLWASAKIARAALRRAAEVDRGRNPGQTTGRRWLQPLVPGGRMEAQGQYAAGDEKRRLCHWPCPIRTATSGSHASAVRDTARNGMAGFQSANGRQLASLVVK